MVNFVIFPWIIFNLPRIKKVNAFELTVFIRIPAIRFNFQNLLVYFPILLNLDKFITHIAVYKQIGLFFYVFYVSFFVEYSVIVKESMA